MKNFIESLVIMFVLHLFLTTTGFSQSQSEGNDIENYIKTERISEKVLLLKCGVNYYDAMTAIATQKGIVIIDAGWSVTLTKKYRKIIEHEFGRNDFIYIITTHPDMDHIAGNQVFPEAEIIGHENGIEPMLLNWKEYPKNRKGLIGWIDQNKTALKGIDSNSDEWRQMNYTIKLASMVLDDYDNCFQLRLPEIIFNDKLSLDLGDITLNLLYFGKAHTRSDVVIYIPEEKLLFNGDLFVVGGADDLREFRNQNVKKQDVDKWYATLNTLSEPSYEIAKIITGHGYVINKNDLAAFHNKVKIIWETFNAGKELSSKIKLEQVLAESGLEAMMNEYRNIKSDTNSKYYFFESEYNNWGYTLLNEGKSEEAIVVFTIAVEMFSDSWNAYDSLGEAYMKSGDKQHSIENYEKSLQLNPDSQSGKGALKQLKEEK